MHLPGPTYTLSPFSPGVRGDGYVSEIKKDSMDLQTEIEGEGERGRGRERESTLASQEIPVVGK